MPHLYSSSSPAASALAAGLVLLLLVLLQPAAQGGGIRSAAAHTLRQKVSPPTAAAAAARGFNEARGAPICGASRGSAHANSEDALSACKEDDHCTHGARCLPCALALPVECDLEGASHTCGHSFMCDTTVGQLDGFARVERWHLHDNVIHSDSPHPDLN